MSFFFLIYYVFLEILYVWLFGLNFESIFVLVLNGLLRLNLEVWFKLKVLVFLNGGGLVLNFFVLVFVI